MLPCDRYRVTTVQVTQNFGTKSQVQLQYTNTTNIGHGSFGVVLKAKLVGSNTLVAIKKTLQDGRYQNCELDILRKINHPNIVSLRYYFYSSDNKNKNIFLNLVLEYVPENLARVIRSYTKSGQRVPVLSIKLYAYQMFRGIGFLHCKGICHRDIKPHNLLVNKQTEQLKVCDFGSAKQLIQGEPNVAYICSRYYRAPELILGCATYTNSIDVWACGCVLAEMMIGKPIFVGESNVDQLVEIVKWLGTPTREQMESMNKEYKDLKLPHVNPHPWHLIFRPQTPKEAITLTSRILEYTPSSRITPLAACAHAFFNDLRKKECRLLNGRVPPPLFNFYEEELAVEPSLNQVLIPKHAVAISQQNSEPSSQ